MMQDWPLRIEPLAGYTPAIGRLVGMLTYARATTLAAVEGLTLGELDHLHDTESNSIGALLAHAVAVERSYQVLTLDALASRDDAWLDIPVSAAPRINVHWAWFHVAEDEINHRGQIRWLRTRLPRRIIEA